MRTSVGSVKIVGFRQLALKIYRARLFVVIVKIVGSSQNGSQVRVCQGT